MRGIVLRRTKLGETDLIVTLLADVAHQVRAVAKGARKPGSRLTGVMNLGNEVELLLHEGRALDVVTEGHVLTSRCEVARELERMVLAEAVLDCAAELTAEGEHDGRLLPLTARALDAVERAPVPRLPLLAAAYVLKAAAVQGFRPSLDACVRCGGPVELDRPGRTLFDLAEGGAVCASCAGVASGHTEDNTLLGWLRACIGLTFADLESWEFPDPRHETSLGMGLLLFAQRWLGHYPGIHPRALDFALTSGLY